MVNNLIIAREAELDLDEAYGWYEGRQAGVGKKFLANVAIAVQKIARFPEGPRILVGNYRRVLVQRFPYVIIYDFVDDTVTVYGIFHSSSDPNKWRRRLP